MWYNYEFELCWARKNSVKYVSSTIKPHFTNSKIKTIWIALFKVSLHVSNEPAASQRFKIENYIMLKQKNGLNFLDDSMCVHSLWHARWSRGHKYIIIRKLDHFWSNHQVQRIKRTSYRWSRIASTSCEWRCLNTNKYADQEDLEISFLNQVRSH